MRIRKEVANWNIKLFIKTTLILLVVLNGLLFFINYLSGRPPFEYFMVSWVVAFLQPVLLASVFAYNARKVLLFVNDYQPIDSFREKLNTVILGNGTQIESADATQTTYIATGWFYRLFSLWGRTEVVRVQWGNQVVVEGQGRLISQIEDSLTWNKMFRTSPVKV
ncbi:MAG: hypothetical protein KF775_05305 [Cyclobacteriaceae bacterium]|nr:hypothetical protein [Cyclobacteriaceae bacterium]